MNEPLTEQTLLLYCMKHYDGGFLATTDDFYEDLSRIKYIKKLITRYKRTGDRDDLKERLILNHIIVLINVFGAVAASRILYYHLINDMDIIKPFMVFAGIMPEQFSDIHEIGNTVVSDMITMDQTVIEVLRNL